MSDQKIYEVRFEGPDDPKVAEALAIWITQLIFPPAQLNYCHFCAAGICLTHNHGY